ncbi:(2Fe-2S)-binding protein [Kyrpidia spormannii]|uniref:Sarcosine oxidase subunit alpha n=2 Tax=Kyrpidia spormannii TaxID=2055160 RepID=A0ACA8Z6Y3_9BACL|nr:(2Fe-2S)-binding protein [Kyrpidia spormannii]CAB3390674.1 Sarcosine oxidase subunit alpha [Kyrpidia spormannii]CAB3391590.1 (2Fe-2S)-binding protein [Kyrpidia spormannii]HHY67309.1 (2Fe-2S)-binding protein [Alicyclobacillus sp.]
MRIHNHPILPDPRGAKITFQFDGVTYEAIDGDSIASALLANGVRVLRRTEKNGESRGIYCGIGHCYECRVYWEGVGEVRACLTPVEDGMRLRTQGGDPGHER